MARLKYRAYPFLLSAASAFAAVAAGWRGT